MPNIMLGVKETIFLIGLEQKKVKVPIATNKQRVRPWYGPVIKLQNLATSPLTRNKQKKNLHSIHLVILLTSDLTF